MVPPTAAAALPSSAPAGAKPAAALTSGGGAGLPAPLAAGPITGVSTINSRLPGAQSLPPITAGTDDDEDEDDPTAKKPNPALLTPEGAWSQKYPQPIQLLVQVSLGADA